jgi:nucleotide-binding universal stress UspA family protein
VSLFRQILAPFDFSDLSEKGVEYARELAATHQARVTILHVIQEPTFPSFYKLGALRIYGMVPDAEKLAWRALEKRFGLPDDDPAITYAVVKGEAESQIIDYAQKNDQDLIVISSHGLTGLEHVLLGSVAEKVVRNARCPVLVVKALQAEREAARAAKKSAGKAAV